VLGMCSHCRPLMLLLLQAMMKWRCGFVDTTPLPVFSGGGSVSRLRVFEPGERVGGVWVGETEISRLAVSVSDAEMVER